MVRSIHFNIISSDSVKTLFTWHKKVGTYVLNVSILNTTKHDFKAIKRKEHYYSRDSP